MFSYKYSKNTVIIQQMRYSLYATRQESGRKKCNMSWKYL